MRRLKLGKYVVAVGNERKILFPKSKITKGELIEYYRRIAPIMIPYMKDRPLTMQRFPQGIDEEGFYQKDAPDYFPKWIKFKSIKKKADGYVRYVVCNNAATLVYLANQACITPHLWLSKIDKLRYPDRMIFDLDPSGRDFNLVRKAAKQLKSILDQLELPSFVMTTGSRGLHIVIPLKRGHHFDWVRSFARDIAELIVQQSPRQFTLEIRKVKRRGRVFIDILRNAYGQTGVAPYAVRPKPGAPIATPITWKEAFNPRLTPQRYTIKNIFRRLAQKDDPWQDINKFACSLSKARKLFRTLI